MRPEAVLDAIDTEAGLQATAEALRDLIDEREAEQQSQENAQ